MIDVSDDIKFQTSRSGGKGGQNVNKVETAVMGSLHVASSPRFTEDQKTILLQKLANRINSDGFFQVKSQIHRTQLANKDEVIERINYLIYEALKKKKARIATRPGKRSAENRLNRKKQNAETKQGRKKMKPGDY